MQQTESITFTNGKMHCRNMAGEAATRATRNLYNAAIVGRNAAGKLVVCFATWNVELANEAFAKVKQGRFVNHKFKGCTDLEIVSN